GVSVYIAGDRWLSLASSAVYNAIYCLVALWAVTLLNIIGVQRAKWLQNFGGIATWLIAAIIVVSAGWASHLFGAATTIGWANVVPDFGSVRTVSLIAVIAFAFDGFELAPVLAGEIKDPARTMPRAIVLSGIAIAAIYIFGTLGLLVALPSGKIDIIAGIPQALAAMGDRVGLPMFGAIAAALLTLSQLGGLSAWVMGTARLPFVIGVDRYFPSALSRLHPTYQTPHIALLTQATIVTLVLWAALSNSTIHETYLVLVDMTVILTFVPLLYIFAALPVLRRSAAGDNTSVVLVPGGMAGCWVAAILGFATTLLGIVFAMIPPENSSNPVLFFLKVGGGCLLLIGIGLAFYWRGRIHRYSFTP
ncbi:MAG TPA: APC family permease, partial [Gemmatimonadaceae bacterium]